MITVYFILFYRILNNRISENNNRIPFVYIVYCITPYIDTHTCIYKIKHICTHRSQCCNAHCTDTYYVIDCIVLYINT